MESLETLDLFDGTSFSNWLPPKPGWRRFSAGNAGCR
jgi:hypothetical protein